MWEIPYSQKGSDILPSWMNCWVPLVRIWEKIDCITTLYAEWQPFCWCHIFLISVTTSQPEAQTCSPSTIQCPDGTCVREVAFCEKHPAKFCLGPWVHPCKKGGRCYSDEEKCNGWQNCGDGSDEFECSKCLLTFNLTGDMLTIFSMMMFWLFFQIFICLT